MSNDIQTLDLSILGREYRVSCGADERESIVAAADFLISRMNETAEMTRASGERLAVTTALNLAHELLSMSLPGGFDMKEFRRRILDMESRLDEVLAQQESLF